MKRNVPILIPLDDNQPSRAIVLLDLPVVIGRSREAAIRVDGLHVDAVHCVVYLEGKHLAVKDEQTWAGTYVNGQRIDRQHLRVGDRLRVGGQSFLISCLGSHPSRARRKRDDQPCGPPVTQECPELEAVCAIA